MVHLELTVIRNATMASLAGEAPDTAKILVDLALIATVTDSDNQLEGRDKGSRVELRANNEEPRRAIEVAETYDAIRSVLAAHSAVVTV